MSDAPEERRRLARERPGSQGWPTPPRMYETDGRLNRSRIQGPPARSLTRSSPGRMMTLSTDDVRALLHVATELQQASSHSFVHRPDLVGALGSLLHVDVVGHLVWREGGRVLEEPGGWGRDDSMHAEYRRHFQTVDPISPLLRGCPGPLIVESLMDYRALKRTEYFADFLTRHRTYPGISMSVEDGTGMLLDYRFGTSDAKKRFGVREQTLLQLLQPYLLNAHRLRQASRPQSNAVSAGNLRFVLKPGQPPQPNRRARTLLASLGRERRDALCGLLCRIGEGLPADMTWSGFVLCVERWKDGAGPIHGCTTVHLLADTVGSAAWFVQYFDMTWREAEVSHLILQGMSDKQIAMTLKISYWTVRIYVARIFDKLGIESRSAIGQLVVRIQSTDPEPERGDASDCRLGGADV